MIVVMFQKQNNMASIDKIYAESYKEYMDFVNWAKDKSIDFYYPGKSLKVHVMNYVYYPYWDEEDFETSERPITNTPEFITALTKMQKLSGRNAGSPIPSDENGMEALTELKYAL